MKKHLGSKFDDFLEEQGMLEESDRNKGSRLGSRHLYFDKDRLIGKPDRLGVTWVNLNYGTINYSSLLAHRLVVCASLLLFFALRSGRSSGQQFENRELAAPANENAQGNFVSVVSMDGLIEKPANLFNLQGRTLRFTPETDGTYKIISLATSNVVQCNQMLDDRDAQGPYQARGWPVSLSFPFTFGGKTWDRLFVNRNGNISFAKSEGDSWSQHDPWSDGGMRSVAAAIDSRSAAGLEQMISVLWGTYDPDSHRSQISIRQSNDVLVVTWNVTRINWGQTPAGVNIFQARLFKSGVIEMVYPRVFESDGIVGLFTGQPVTGRSLHHWQHTGKADPSVDIDSTDIYDAGSVLKFVITMKNDAIANVRTGTLDYRCLIHRNGFGDQVAVSVTDTQGATSSLDPSPTAVGFQIRGKTVEMFVSKVSLAGCLRFTPEWNVIWWGMDGRNLSSGKGTSPVDLQGIARGEADFSDLNGTFSGNIFEVFHYAQVNKKSERLLQVIYKTVPAEDDIALVFTDFRLDDLYGIGGGAIAANFPIKGIGSGEEHPRSTASIGSKQLQMSIATAWIGGPGFAESGIDDGNRRWANFAHGVKWITHECTHRWGMNMSFRDPRTGKEEKLADGSGHWLEGLNTVSLAPMASHYLDRASLGNSIMGGTAWRQNTDGTFSKSDYPSGVPGGYSAIDLYVMGLLPPEKVPETFLIADLKDLGNNRFSGTKVPVRIADITAVMGPRLPSAAQAQKTFRMTFYLVHEPNREVNTETLAKARKLSAAASDFFMQASGGEMRVVPTH
jgi:hypothetical protein